MSFGELDDKSGDAGELRVESKSMFASRQPALRVRKAFRIDSPKKNGLRRLRCSRPCPRASRLPGCPEAPGPGAACGVLLQPLACETPRRAGSTPTAVDAHAFELECHSKPGSSPSRAPGPRAFWIVRHLAAGEALPGVVVNRARRTAFASFVSLQLELDRYHVSELSRGGVRAGRAGVTFSTRSTLRTIRVARLLRRRTRPRAADRAS